MSTDTNIVVALPSLIHRLGSERVKQVKSLVVNYGCNLKRVRRSRNWQLVGQAEHVQSFMLHLKTLPIDEWRYLIAKIEAELQLNLDKLESLEDKLARVIAASPNITLAELMHATNCTLIEARTARFKAEF